MVVQGIELAEIKTRLLAEQLREMGSEDALIVTKDRDRRLELASRNLPNVKVLPVAGLNVRDVLARRHLVLTHAALDAIVARLQ